MSSNSLVKLSDYKPYAYRIPSIELYFCIESEYVMVKSLMVIQPVEDKNIPLILEGVELELKEIFINNMPLDDKFYHLENNQLIIERVCQGTFSLKIVYKIYHLNNTSLQGLYVSEGMLATQCEAEGFRRITYHPDRPDVLSRYKVSIEADKGIFPILLSNGNNIFSDEI